MEYYKANHNVVDINSLNDLIDELDQSVEKVWIAEPIDFPEREQKESLDYPSEEVVYRLEDDKIANLWPQILDKILKFGVYPAP